MALFAVENTDLEIYWVDSGAQLVDVNTAACRALGYTREELLQKRVWDVDPLTTQDSWRESLADYRDFQDVQIESVHRRKDGSEYPVEISVSRFEHDGNELICGFARDISERKRAEKALRKEKQFADSLIDTAQIVIVVLDTEGRIVLFNPFMEELSGYSLNEVRGRDWFSIFLPSEDHARIRDVFRRAVGDIQTCGNVNSILTKDGEQRVLEWNNKTLKDEHGEVVGLLAIGQDVTERRNAEAALQESEAWFRRLFDHALDGILVADAETMQFAMANPAMCRMVGYSANELTGLSVDDIHPAEELPRVKQEFSRQAGTSHGLSLNIPVLRSDGTVLYADINASRIEIGGKFYLSGIFRDITQQKRDKDRLQLAASVFTHASEGIMITAPDGVIVDVNKAFLEITGYERNEVVGNKPNILKSGRQDRKFYKTLWDTLLAAGSWSGEIWNRRKDGVIYPQMLMINAVFDECDEVTNYVALMTDITMQKEHQVQLEHIAHHDALTNLPNRFLLADRLQQGMAQARRRKQLLAVTYLDLDGFKAINDTHGHDVGDEFLIVLARRLKHALRDGDTFARLGGDEFVGVLMDLESFDVSRDLLERMLASAAQPVHLDDLELQVSASIGVTFYPQSGDVDADQLLRQADQSMYQAKTSGKNCYHFFQPDRDSDPDSKRETLAQIRRALGCGEFVLLYQPKVNMRSGEVIGVEALIRWRHPQHGQLMPGAFLPLVENLPLSAELDEWVLVAAMEQIERWHAEGLEMPVSVNVGARLLQREDFTAWLRARMAAHPGVAPGLLELEVLETSALEDMVLVSSVIRQCAEMGVSFALDDFGTGYSSLTYLKRLPAKQLKIDRSFVHDMLDDPEDLAILDGVIGLASAFRREAIAEGVETVAHGDLLLQLGCERAQGYGIARPMEAGDLPAWIKEWRPPLSWQRQKAVGRDDLPILFAAVEHRAWVKAVAAYVKGERVTPPSLSHDACRFGEWIGGAGGKQFHELSEFNEVQRLHRHMHELAGQLCRAGSANGGELLNERLDELYTTRDRLLSTLQALLKLSGSRA